MANPLTGDFDAAVQFSLEAVNRAAAAHHSDGLYFNSEGWRIDADVQDVHGRLDVQLSTPRIELPAASASPPPSVTVKLATMARLHPDPGTTSVPGDTVDGTLSLTVPVEQTSTPAGEVIRVDPAGADVDFDAAPGSGGAAAESLVNGAAGDLVSDRIGGVEAVVPPSGPNAPVQVHEWRLWTLPAGTPPSIALLLALRSGSGGDPSAASTSFLRPNEDFALAVSGDHLRAMIRELLETNMRRSWEVSLRESLDQLPRVVRTLIRVTPVGWFTQFVTVDLDVRFDPASFDLTLDESSQTIEVTIGAAVDGAVEFRGTEILDVDFQVTVTQGFRVRLVAGRLDVDKVGRADIQFRGADAWLAALFEGWIRNEFDRASDGLVASVESTGPDLLPSDVSGGPFGQIVSEIRLPDLSLQYTDLRIDSDALVVSGTLDFGTLQPIAPLLLCRGFTRDDGSTGLELDAHPSWLPGGTLDDYRFFRDDDPAATEIFEEHRFYTRPPPQPISSVGALTLPSSVVRWCVDAIGHQEGSGATSGRACCDWTVGSPGVPGIPGIPGMPILKIPVVIDWWRGPEAGDDDSEPIVVAHMDLQGRGGSRPTRSKRSGGGHLLVHLGGDERTIRTLHEAVTTRDGRNAGLHVLLAAPEELPRLPHAEPDGSETAWSLTSDPNGGWAQALGGKGDGPVTVLSGPDRWLQHLDSDLEAADLRRVIDARLEKGSPLAWSSCCEGLQRGDRVPEFWFSLERERRMPLRRLLGRKTVICFWTAWSEPSLEELGRLARTVGSQRGGPALVAVNDGDEVEHAREALDAAELDLPITFDPQGRIGDQFGINVWPTTVFVDERGRVSGIRRGLPPEGIARPYDRKQSSGQKG